MELEQEKDAGLEEISSPPAQDVKRKRALVRRLGRAAALQARHNTLPVSADASDGAKVPQEHPKRRRPYLWSFIALVVLPSLAVLYYFLFVASPQFQSRAQFAVRAMGPDILEADGETRTTSDPFSFISPAQNAYIVTNYIRSRAIIDDIGSGMNIREIFQRPEADVLTRLQDGASADALASYWNGMVDTYVDSLSGIVTVSVTAFRPEDASRLSQAILQQSEKLINRISDRARQDATRSAQGEVQKAFTNLQASLKALEAFRNQESIIDPTQSTSQITALLMPLMTEQLKLKNDESVMAGSMASDAPGLRALRSRIAALDAQIANLRGQLTGNDSNTIATSLAKFEELDVDRALNERKYTRSKLDLDRAEARARRQAVYLSVFIPPSTPGYAEFPYRLRYSFLFFMTMLILWAIGAFIHASIEDHRL